MATSAKNIGSSLQNSKLGEMYDIRRLLGKGAFGKVYEVRHKTDKKHYAVKITEFADNTASREIQSLSSLDHRNVVRYTNSWYDEYEDQDNKEEFRSSEIESSTDYGEKSPKKLFIVMELCENRTLKHVITEEKLFTNPKRVKELFGQICQGLKHIHQKNIIHRDLKPSNIFLSKASYGECIKIGDFGWSRRGKFHYGKGFLGTICL